MQRRVRTQQAQIAGVLAALEAACDCDELRLLRDQLLTSLPPNAAASVHLATVEACAARIAAEKRALTQTKEEILGALAACIAESGVPLDKSVGCVEQLPLATIRRLQAQHEAQLGELRAHRTLLLTRIRRSLASLTALASQDDDPLATFLTGVNIDQLEDLPLSALVTVSFLWFFSNFFCENPRLKKLEEKDRELANLVVLRFERIFASEYFMLQQIWRELALDVAQQDAFYASLDRCK